MKKYLSILFFLIHLTTIRGQVVFCPSGAEWRAIFTVMIWSQSLSNTTITYSGDSIAGQDTIKILKHDKFYGQCNSFKSKSTLIKQKGDTVFFRNYFTSNTWQIMYNFACLPGQGWTTTYVPDGGGARTYTFTVDSVNTISINSTPLKQLFVTYKYNYNIGVQTYTASIVERMGWGFLFNYRNNSGSCDGDYFSKTLCYSDNSLGEYKFTEYPCNYSNLTGIETVSSTSLEMQTFPNPVQDLLVINSNVNYLFTLTDIMGSHQNIKSTFINSQMQLDVQSLPRGIYLLRIFDNERLIDVQKVVKE